jgi:hypothetical protein
LARNGSGVYSLPAGSTVSNGDTSDASDLNAPLADIEADLNTPRPVVAGGTGASTAADARTNLGLVIGTNVQAYNAALASIAGLTTAADRMIYTTASNVYAVATLSSFARTILDDADAATVRATIGAQASDGALTTLAGLSLSAGDVLYSTGADTVARLAIGTANQVLRVNAGATAPEWAAPVGGAPDFVLEDQKASGTNGQTLASAGVWITRDLNAEVRDVASIVSVASNEFTVTANAWVEWQCMGRDAHMTRLYNVTDATTVATSLTATAAGVGQVTSGGAAVTAGKTYRIEVNTSTAGQVHVAAAGRGVTEVYTRIKGWRS